MAVAARGRIDYLAKKERMKANSLSNKNLTASDVSDRLGLAKIPLARVRFAELTMRTADDKETALHEYVEFELGVAGIWRNVFCFVVPEEQPTSLRGNRFNLLLGIPWLHDMAVVLMVKDFRVQIGDPTRREPIRMIEGPQFTYSSDHKLLMYPRTYLKARQLVETVAGSDVNRTHPQPPRNRTTILRRNRMLVALSLSLSDSNAVIALLAKKKNGSWSYGARSRRVYSIFTPLLEDVLLLSYNSREVRERILAIYDEGGLDEA